MRVEVTRSGTLTGFLYWFSLHFPITGATIHTHHHRQVDIHTYILGEFVVVSEQCYKSYHTRTNVYALRIL